MEGNMSTVSSSAAVSPSAQSFLARPKRLYIDGKWVDARSGDTFAVYDPATGRQIAKVAAGDAADIDVAVRAARRAFDEGAWSDLSPASRRKLMFALAAEIEANVDEISRLETLDNGMPLSVAGWLAGTASPECLRYNAGWIDKIHGDTPVASLPDHHAYTLKEPIGVVGAITPWNAPMLVAVGKLAPALAAGCTVVLKPAELTPLSALYLAELAQKVGFPPGVINVVTGFGHTAGKALSEHPEVDKIAFTGSTVVGKQIVRAAAGNLKRVSLELGGKSPVFIFEDADLTRAAAGAAAGIFTLAGQVCVAGSRLYVHKKIFDRVVQDIAGHARALRVGPGNNAQTQMGPLVSQQQLARVMGYIESGRSEGAEVVTGGAQLGTEGFFLQPTVLAQTNRNMRVVQEEIFGPVICAMPFDSDDVDDIARMGNDTSYGLSAYIWTGGISTAHKLAKRLRTGTIRINGGSALEHAIPFGGYKQSGWGRENGREGVETFLETKAVTIQL
jgi:phenylacetaldehyde dehydrogenase